MRSPVITFLACVAACAYSQNLPNGHAFDPRYTDGGLASDPDRMHQFRNSCPQQCECSEAACGLQVDCSFRQLTEVPQSISPLTECLDLSMNNISKITVESFEGLKQLKKLCLTGNHITELPQNVFAGCRKLEELLMQDNKLQAIPPNTVSKLPNLKDLNLGANYISSISSNAFAKLEKLEHVWLDDNRLAEIPSRALSRAPTIKALALDVNKITVVRNGDLDALSMLNVLLLKHNAIQKIENNAFERSTSIQIIDLSYNNLTSLPPAIKDALKLHQLTLSYNKISFLPDFAFAGNPELRTLTLMGNPIKNAGKTAFTGLKNLDGLYLENAEDLTEFPDLSESKELTTLVITGGKLKQIPKNLCASFPNLQELNLSGNRIRNISGLIRCNNLTILDVSGNELTEVTFSETKNMTKMKQLNLGNNKIRHLDDMVFSKMIHIEELNLAHNIFTFLPMRGLGSVRELNISGVRTMLYLPPNVLFHNLRSLAAYYPYHCCQVKKIPRKEDDNSIYRLRQYIPSIPPASNEDFTPRESPVQCSPNPLPMTPCDDLLPSMPIRVFWWLAMIVSFLLNGIILLSCGLRYFALRRSRIPTTIPSDEEILRRADSESPYPDARMVTLDSDAAGSHYCLNFSRRSRGLRSETDTFDMSLCHLALADFIVSSYTAIILSYDQSTRGEFAENGAWWQQSAFCHSAGFLLTFGTQLAFCTVAVMAIERYLATMYPLKSERHMRKNILIMTLSSAWIVSLATATVTLFGGAGDEEADTLLNMLPAKSGATCLPWTTEFAYIAVLVGVHIFVCVVLIIVCGLMFFAKRKQSWLSARKSTRRQVTIAVVVNISFILPLALLAVIVSGHMTYSDLVSGLGGEYAALEDILTKLDMGRVLSFAMFVIPFRPLLNPVLYLLFNRPLRRDLKYLFTKLILGDFSSRRAPFPQRHNSVSETMFDSVADVPQEASNSYPLFSSRPVFDSEYMRQTVAYDNRGIVSSSSVSYHAPSISLAPSTSRTGASQRTASSERRKRRRYTRSQRGERRTTDTDPTTETEIITFHRGGEVSYNPAAKERRKKKLSVRNGGVNAKDEFQRLVFPRVPNASSSDHGSDSTVYPIMPATMTAVTGSSSPRQSSKNLSCDADASDVSSADCLSTRVQRRTEHYDISALNAYYGQNAGSGSSATNSSRYQGETSSEPTDASYDADMEVAEINAGISPVSQDENPFFDDRDTAKRLYAENARKKSHHQRSREDDCHPSTSNAIESDFEQTNNNIYHAHQGPMRKDRVPSHSSGVSNDTHLIGRLGKMGNSCEYCDSSASKDSGIHSEIDSTSGASYSDTSIGRRLHFSTSGGGLKSIDMSTIGERDIGRYNLTTFAHDFEVVANLDGTNEVKINPILNPETTI